MLNLEQVRQFLYYEARLLDDRQWDEWLSCYSPQVVYWMPAWGDDDQLTRDPQKEISLIYYPNREGLEDRVYRIKTERSGASTPEPRTTHIISNVELMGESERGSGGALQLGHLEPSLSAHGCLFWLYLLHAN
ncbi:benzoate 1,2-dioxygenase subunit beta [Klebsiella pneumoniae]|uniref:Benzoate 1,2-dioxygenase subunit beta n=1 Tax=Klebsiella pneumoniae TaxID=573 RepID=A0A2X3EXF6_KLEPN|nr:benzoate 1,2-dioxygenase subunit beta [Klebsiella pneumoniae]